MKSIISLILFISTTLLSAQTKSELIEHIPNSNPVFDFSLSEDSVSIFYFVDNHFISYNIVKGVVDNKVKIPINSTVIALEKLPNEDHVLIGTKAGSVLLVDIPTMEILSIVNFDKGSVNCLKVIPSSQYFLCGMANGMIYKCNSQNLEEYEIFHQVHSEVTSIKAFQSDSLIGIIDGGGFLYSYDAITLEFLEQIKVSKKWLRDLDFNPEKKRMIIAGDDGYIYSYKLNNNRELISIEEEKMSGAWITTAGFAIEGKIRYWGGFSHKFFIESIFSKYNIKLGGPVMKAKLIKEESNQIVAICSVYGKGICLVPLVAMKIVK